MKYTKEHGDLILSKIKGSNCDLCNSHKWEMQNNLFYIQEFNSPSTENPGNAAVPLVIMACMDCGNTKLINAIKLGIVDTNGELLPVKRAVNN